MFSDLQDCRAECAKSGHHCIHIDHCMTILGNPTLKLMIEPGASRLCIQNRDAHNDEHKLFRLQEALVG